MAVTVAIQERSRLLREGLALILDPEPEISLVGTVVGGEALFALCETKRPLSCSSKSMSRMGSLPARLPPSTSVAVHAFLGLYRRDGEAAARARRCGFAGWSLFKPMPASSSLSSGLRRTGAHHHPAVGYDHTRRSPAHCPRDPGPAVHRGRMHFEADRRPHERQPQNCRESQTANIRQAWGAEPGTCRIGRLP